MKYRFSQFAKFMFFLIFQMAITGLIPLLAYQNPSQLLTSSNSTLVLTSPEVIEGGILPTDYTGDGSSSTLPLSWEGEIEGTKSFVIIMHHVDPEGLIKEYWNLYNIPCYVHFLPKNVVGIGELGTNTVNKKNEYAPPMSQGPGPKTYTFTLYALSDTLELEIPQTEVTREVLLKAMDGLILGSSSLSVTYSRPEDKISNSEIKGNKPKRNELKKKN